MVRTRTRILRALAVVLVVGLTAGTWFWWAHRQAIRSIALDLRAGALARHSEKPFDRYLEVRYGPMTEATNRQRAFCGYFDVEHIEGMRQLVGFMKPSERQSNVLASAHWIAEYRESMTPAEKESLAAWLRSPEGRAAVQQASGRYRQSDIGYRNATEPVIRELLTTLSTLQSQPAASTP